MTTDISDLVQTIVTSTIMLCRNNPKLEFAALASATAFAAVSCNATEEEAVAYFRLALQSANLGKQMAEAGGIQ